jgi:hypothetical protein
MLTVLAIVSAVACSSPSKPPEAPSPYAAEKAFATPKEAADALVRAASDYDVPTLIAILGPDAKDLVTSPDPVQDRQRAAAFAAKAREKSAIQVRPDDPNRATLTVGRDDWPLPIPIVMSGGRWYFDSAAGRDEILGRRIGENELSVIDICRGYVEAQKRYASQPHESGVNEYARRVISTPGKRDGLAWQNPDGTWGGPVGEPVASAIAQGYSAQRPFHGYYFKTLTGQGPAARLGALDYVVNGAMIGGFALVAWPAEYGVTGVQTFMVSYDGAAYQKDLGPQTGTMAPAIDRYNPDPTWKRTEDSP